MELHDMIPAIFIIYSLCLRSQFTIACISGDTSLPLPSVADNAAINIVEFSLTDIFPEVDHSRGV